MPKMKTVDFVNSIDPIDPEEVAHHKPPHSAPRKGNRDNLGIIFH